MTDEPTVLHGYGYEFDEIDEIAKGMLDSLTDIGTPPRLAMLALARTMVVVGGPRNLLDLACRMIDDLSDLAQQGDLEWEFPEEDGLMLTELDSMDES